MMKFIALLCLVAVVLCGPGKGGKGKAFTVGSFLAGDFTVTHSVGLYDEAPTVYTGLFATNEGAVFGTLSLPAEDEEAEAVAQLSMKFEIADKTAFTMFFAAPVEEYAEAVWENVATFNVSKTGSAYGETVPVKGGDARVRFFGSNSAEIVYVIDGSVHVYEIVKKPSQQQQPVWQRLIMMVPMMIMPILTQKMQPKPQPQAVATTVTGEAEAEGEGETAEGAETPAPPAAEATEAAADTIE
ncbi:hypothetical protein KIPB_008127 [Kipferlia bialata]|uniref:Uncharacterized protein n=1 Tax=Kipferlia bialata TaxID=797122 RepID=A0A391NND5_9EUKA|nr:hypothetical protein KIPB_008127 [Kipferlia bialata]|eukprot:g8127.t1